MEELPPVSVENLSRVDRQGAVEVSITPIGTFGESGEMLLFDVAMNTHSVDLSMDLAALSTLETDSGETLQAVSWSGGSGHHVRGQLSFPMYLENGVQWLDGATQVILSIHGVDADERIFVWQASEIQ
jgi:hypothetical protein